MNNSFSGWADTKPTKYGLNRERLPKVPDYYRQHIRKLGKTKRNGWAVGICPFHSDSKPSLSVNMRSGGYKCFACNASGGDVIAFHMAQYGFDFPAACRDLGAWGGSSNE